MTGPNGSKRVVPAARSAYWVPRIQVIALVVVAVAVMVRSVFTDTDALGWGINLVTAAALLVGATLRWYATTRASFWDSDMAHRFRLTIFVLLAVLIGLFVIQWFS